MKTKLLSKILHSMAIISSLIAVENASAVNPVIAIQPVSSYGLNGGQVQFSVLASNAPLSYQWFFTTTNGSVVSAVSDGTQTSGSVVSGSASPTLQFVNLQSSDATNFVVVVTNPSGSTTSSNISLLAVTNHAILAYWDFNGSEFTNTLVYTNSIKTPTPYLGSGSAQTVGSATPNSGAVDPIDGIGFALNGHLPNQSWGTAGYPASGGNKANGVQFKVSTVGAQNILVTYDSRVSATASDYERLQYTTNGTTWIDYPSSSSFNGVALTTYAPFSYNLTGFPGVDNNPNFGIRVVTEFMSTALYGNSPSNIYAGTQNDYGTTGTVTYDIVTISGDAITNAAASPVIGSISNTNMVDSDPPLTIGFTVADSSTSPDLLNYSATSLSSFVSPSISFGGSGTNRTLTITPNGTPDQTDTGPILVTVADPNTGKSAATSFLLTINSVNFAPTNSLASLIYTNTLVNTPITIPFTVSDDRTPASGLTYTVATYNSSLIPAANVVLNGQGTTNPSVTITPAANQIGMGRIMVTVTDNDAVVSRSTSALLAVAVRPNTNVIALDYFNYDSTGPLELVGTNFWSHLTGNLNQLQYANTDARLGGNGYAVLDGNAGFTDNLFAPLIGAPYLTNSTSVLYMSFIANMDPTGLPIGNGGSYFIVFQDGTSRGTANVNCRVVATTNGAAAGFYRLAIYNNTASTTNAIQFPVDLTPGSNYVVVASDTVSNGMSRLWVNPSSRNSPSVADTNAISPTNVFNASAIFIRESGGLAAGRMRIAKLKVGTTFDSVLPSLTIHSDGTNAVVSSSDPTLPIQSATDVSGPYTDAATSTPYTNSIGTGKKFYRFKR